MSNRVILDNEHKRLLDNLKTGVMLLDHKLCLRYINVAAENLIDISDRKARHLVIGDVFIGAKLDTRFKKAKCPIRNS